MSHLTWALGAESGSSGRAAGALNRRVDSLGLPCFVVVIVVICTRSVFVSRSAYLHLWRSEAACGSQSCLATMGSRDQIWVVRLT